MGGWVGGFDPNRSLRREHSPGRMAKRRVRLSTYTQQSFDYNHSAQQYTVNCHSTQNIQSTVIRFQPVDSKTYSHRSFDSGHTVTTLSFSANRLNNIQSHIIRFKVYNQQSFDFNHLTQHRTVNNHSNEGIQSTVIPKSVAFRLYSNSL